MSDGREIVRPWQAAVSTGSPRAAVPSEPTTPSLRDAIDAVLKRHPSGLLSPKVHRELLDDLVDTFAARVEVGPSPEQIDAAAKAFNDTGYDYAFGKVTPWERLDEDVRSWYRGVAKVVLVAACSVRGDQTARTED